MAETIRPPLRQKERTASVLSAPQTPEHTSVSPVETVIKTDSLVLLTGTAHRKLAHTIGANLGKILDEPITVFEASSRFPDTSIDTTIQPNLRNRHVFFIQGAPAEQRAIEGQNGSEITMSMNDAVAEVNFAIDAVRRASAAEITIITPYHFNERKDRKDKPRVSITAAVTAQTYEFLGADRIVTIDLHAEQEQGFVRIPWDNVYASYVFVPEIEKLGFSDLVVATPDLGGIKMAKNYKDKLNTKGFAVVLKDRDYTSGAVSTITKESQIIGDVQGKRVLLVDDIIGSAKTAKQALEILKANGATEVYFAATHAFLSKESMENLQGFTHVFFTDSVNHDNVTLAGNMTEVSIAPLFAEIIKRIHTGESVSEGLIRNGKQENAQQAA